jgi:hypothetical protein
MPTPLIPFETCSIPDEIQKELVRRQTNRSFNYQKNDGWSKDGGDWEKYKGPMTSWVRACSNGIGRPELNKPGFVITGGKSFYQTYGFQDKNQQILGYTPDGKPHTLDNDKNSNSYPINVPNPEIVKVETIIQKELYRRAWIHWTCFSSKQLEYMTPYFLVPGITLVLEFGWNHFNPNSLIDLTNESKLYEYFFKNPYPLYNENILLSNGNYDVVYGMITNYEWSVEGNKINCMTEVTSKDRLYAGIPISSIVTDIRTGDTKDPIVYFDNIKKLCDSNFIKNIKAIASLKELKDAEADKELSQQQLYSYVKGMKNEYWRGIFYGRDEKNIKLSNQLDFKWSNAIKGDFDYENSKDQEVWANMGFIVDLLNKCFPYPDPEGKGYFFEVNVDESIIGAHPNQISCDGSKLLIPNSFAPKYFYGDLGKQQNQTGETPGAARIFLDDLISSTLSSRPKTISDYGRNDYLNQFLTSKKTINKQNKDLGDVFWSSDYQLTKTFYQGNTPFRDDLDFVINANRYIYQTERDHYSFPFRMTETLPITNRPGETAKYDPYFYGYFKDLYINLKYFVNLVNNPEIKTYVDLYKKIFDDFNKAGGSLWELALVENSNTSKLVVVDNRMLPSGNNKATPWYFNYMDSDQLMTNLGFKPKMSDAQACRVIFGETNNTGSRTVVKEENDLLNYKFDDRILIKHIDKPPVIVADRNVKLNAFRAEVMIQQNLTPMENQYQFTIEVEGKPYIRRLVLPDSDLLNMLLDDGDKERNQRYTGLQPITVEVGLQGLGGLRTFMTFLIRNLPNPYNHNDVAYRIVDVHHVLQNGKWDTTIKAGIIPLRGYVKQKIGIKDVKNVDRNL